MVVHHQQVLKVEGLAQVFFECSERLLIFVIPQKPFIALQCSKEWKTFICSFENEPIESCYPLGQTLHLFCSAWRLYVDQHLYFLQIGFYTSLVDHKFEEFFGSHAKCALEQIQLHAICSKDNVSAKCKTWSKATLDLTSISST